MVWPIACWGDCVFQSLWEHGCVSVVSAVCCECCVSYVVRYRAVLWMSVSCECCVLWVLCVVCCECCVLWVIGLCYGCLSLVSAVCCECCVSYVVRYRAVLWMSVSCECCVFLSGRCLCDRPIPRPEESYRVWYMSVISKPQPWPTTAVDPCNKKGVCWLCKWKWWDYAKGNKFFTDSFSRGGGMLPAT